jgi:deazaflavin-dependent oxidoreductase (nitroreductase family)
VVEHRGRRSGRRYRTPVLALPVDGGYVVSLFYGADRDWVRNVLAAGGCTLRCNGRQPQLTRPSLLTGRDAAALAPAWLRPALRPLSGIRLLRLSPAPLDDAPAGGPGAREEETLT